jgi:hypothetical protein
MGWRLSMEKQNGFDSDFRADQLVLYGAATIVLLILAWTFVD